ncbi:hypothetical protein [Saccharopolyspora hattusasensis]|uniref:hypothetical protein n=1 Tax=Saccharopolyspora hattusasensis TaxID=1128679 RepID=UPI003D983367
MQQQHLRLIPFCGVTPGHDRDTLLECVAFGLPCCITCVSPEALEGFTPLIMEEAFAAEGQPAWEDDVPTAGSKAPVLWDWSCQVTYSRGKPKG